MHSKVSYLVVVTQYPAQSTCVLFSQPLHKLVIIARYTKLVLVVALFPTVLPETNIVLRLTVTVCECECVCVLGGGWG